MSNVRPRVSTTEDLQLTLSFESAVAWATWLAKNHGASSGAWLRLAEKYSGTSSVAYADAIDVAL